MKKTGRVLSLLFAGAASLLIAPHSYAAEAGEYPSTVADIPFVVEKDREEITGELAPAIAMTPDGEIICSPEEMPEMSEMPEMPEIIAEEELIVGGRSERLAYLSSMRHYFMEDGENQPLSKYAEWLVTEQGWDPNGWLYELLGELYPDEVATPDPIPEPADASISDHDESDIESSNPMPDSHSVATVEEEVESDVPTELPIPVTVHDGVDPWTEYTVSAGDSLWKIAEQFYGKQNGRLWWLIYNENQETIQEPGRIYTGQVLKVPYIAG